MVRRETGQPGLEREKPRGSLQKCWISGAFETTQRITWELAHPGLELE